MIGKLPNIFEYVEFRKYLEDYRKARITFDSGFTHLYICYRLGMKKSRGYFNNIVKGRKNISPQSVDKFINLLELKSDEGNYFRALVNYAQTKSPQEKEFYFDQIVTLNSTPKKLIDKRAYAYFKEWYHSTIRELLEIYDFDGDYKELAKKLEPKITVSEAKRSVNLLKNLGLIKKNDKGFIKPTDKVITTGDNVRNNIIEQYQIKSLERAKERIVNNPKKHRTSTLTISASPEALKRVVKKMEQFRSEIRSIAHKDDGNDKKVYEIIIHAHAQST